MAHRIGQILVETEPYDRAVVDLNLLTEQKIAKTTCRCSNTDIIRYMINAHTISGNNFYSILSTYRMVAFHYLKPKSIVMLLF